MTWRATVLMLAVWIAHPAGAFAAPEADASKALPMATVQAASTDLPDASAASPVVERAAQDGDAHTLFQAGMGLLALPAAKVCPTLSRCEPGETSFALTLRSLGRYRNFAFGAGINWGFGLRPSDDIRADVDPTLERRHSRSYFVFDGEFRYYLPSTGGWDWWTGATAGLVVVNDSWTTLSDREPYADTAFVGPRAMTLATEGLSVSAGVGGQWRFAEHWIFGTHLRYGNWFLPDTRETTPMGDSSSLAGRVDVFDFGLVVGFRLSL